MVLTNSYTGNLTSESPEDSKTAFLHCGHVSLHYCLSALDADKLARSYVCIAIGLATVTARKGGSLQLNPAVSTSVWWT